MSKQTINLGTVANDNTGDSLRIGGDKINDNFNELYSIHGWGMYNHDQTTPSTQVIDQTPQKLIVDGGGSISESSYLPYEIRGVSELWDNVNNLIVPISIGDSYTLRIDLEVTAKSGNPNELILDLDIGGQVTPSIVIVERIISTGKLPPYTVSVAFPIFTLTTFNANGGAMFLSCDTGTVTLRNRSISIYRISKGNI